jgi:hypothetical protein
VWRSVAEIDRFDTFCAVLKMDKLGDSLRRIKEAISIL